ncbi:MULTISPECIES: hypothetical protein [Pseudomonas]|uniref:Uncharacterized protein n=3 Tax=Pseudomonas TaxID=286 RepID=A0A3G1DGA5_PSEAI|nr:MULTISPECIES: hypothetical protein [Pseudomonas]AXQ51254.1 hypothetical protein DZC31_31880 [Stenotrophomonas rhizophila]MCO6692615.1 hypothetical protein [Pseudomonas shirazica]AMP35683.1 Hypothetical protein [Pseudomonas aeruginosa]ESW38386.1 hypothetical protein O164_18365 [Pseudomonas taiwanensis SJ9]MCE0852840.1 hypothetical protein [Pseudomonas asiatica]
MICNAETYAASGHHHHIATLLAGRSFEGVYLIAEPPETTCIDGEMGLIFIASDLTGSIKCLVDPVRAGWVQGEHFASIRVLLKGQVILIEDQLCARISELHQLKIQW